MSRYNELKEDDLPHETITISNNENQIKPNSEQKKSVYSPSEIESRPSIRESVGIRESMVGKGSGIRPSVRNAFMRPSFLQNLRGLSSTFSVDPEKKRPKVQRQYSAPWTPGGKAKDEVQVEILKDLAGYLTMYGAPLYRVEHRLSIAAEAFKIPLSAFYLPSDIMINIGDGSSQHPSRTSFLKIPAVLNMDKLQRVDKLARDLLKHLKNYREAESRKNDDTGSFISLSPSFIHADSVIQENIAKELKAIVMMPELYSRTFLTIGSAFQCAFLTALFFKGTLADVICAFILGGISNVLQMLADKKKITQGTSIFISIFISFICRFLQVPILWSWTGSSGVCHDTVVIAALALYMPGFQFTLSIMEVGAGQPVAGAVRLFLAFMRSFQVGYGISMGSKLAIHILDWGKVWNPENAANSCPASFVLVTDWWRYIFFVPMALFMMVSIRSHYKQWPSMLFANVTCFIVSQVTKPYFSAVPIS